MSKHPGYLTTEEVQERLGVSHTTISKYLDKGKLKAYRLTGEGYKNFFKESDVKKLEGFRPR